MTQELEGRSSDRPSVFTITHQQLLAMAGQMSIGGELDVVLRPRFPGLIGLRGTRTFCDADGLQCGYRERTIWVWPEGHVEFDSDEGC